jgi:hypothetical protein
LPGKLRLSQPSIALFVSPLTLLSSKGAVSRVPPGRIQPLHPRDAEQFTVQKHRQPMNYLGPAEPDPARAGSCILHKAAAVQGYIGVIRTGVHPPQSLLYPNKFHKNGQCTVMIRLQKQEPSEADATNSSWGCRRLARLAPGLRYMM